MSDYPAGHAHLSITIYADEADDPAILLAADDPEDFQYVLHALRMIRSGDYPVIVLGPEWQRRNLGADPGA